MKRTALLPKFILFLLLLHTSASGQTLIATLADDARRGAITDEQKLVYQLLAVVNPDALPLMYRELATAAGKCGTFPLFEVRKRWDALNPAYKSLLEQYLQRPTSLPTTILSASGIFKIHYTLEGGHATTEQFAQEAAAAFDRAYQVEVVELGYPPPPPDFGIDGPEYDVYIMNIYYYGFTTPEQEITSTAKDDWTSYIAIDNDYSQGFFTSGIEALHVTTAHEFFHAIHFGIRAPIYYPDTISDIFYYEVSSTWMEDVVWDNVNDYLQDYYLKAFFDYPHLPFNSYNGSREYGLAVWNHFIEALFGRETIRRSWELMKEEHGLKAIQLALAERASAFGDAFTEFSLWNYFTAGRADTVNFYEEGRYYPLVKIERTVDFDTEAALSGSSRRLASHYWTFLPEIADYYAAQLQVDDMDDWGYAALVQRNDGSVLYSLNKPPFWTQLGFAGASDTILFVASHTQIPLDTLPSYPDPMYEFTVTIVPDSGISLYTISGYVRDAGEYGVTGVELCFGDLYGSTLTDSSGYYVMADLPDGTYTVKPSKYGYTFTPDSLLVALAGADAYDQNFSAEFAEQGDGITRIYPNPLIIATIGTARIYFQMREDQKVAITVADLNGKIIRDESLGFLKHGVDNFWEWNGKDQSGDYVASGVYLLVIKFEYSYATGKIAVIR